MCIKAPELVSLVITIVFTVIWSACGQLTDIPKFCALPPTTTTFTVAVLISKLFLSKVTVPPLVISPVLTTSAPL